MGLINVALSLTVAVLALSSKANFCFSILLLGGWNLVCCLLEAGQGVERESLGHLGKESPKTQPVGIALEARTVWPWSVLFYNGELDTAVTENWVHLW